MTGPLGPVAGAVLAEVVLTGEGTTEQMHDILEDAGDAGDKDMKKLGKDLGDTFDEELKKSTKNTGSDVAAALAAGIEKGWKPKTIQLDADGNVVRAWLTKETEQGVTKAIKDLETGGVFTKFKSLFTDAIGAGFNVSGKSPLIAFLVPLIGFIGELVLGAVQLVNGLIAVLTVVPNLIGAIILQAGVLFLAFKGVGTAITAAFAAKDAKELEEALKTLTPNAREFVKVLLPLRDVFKELSAIAQEAFFDRVARDFQRMIDALVPLLRGGLADLASGLGDVARGILNVLASPVFTKFLSELIPATVDWLRSFNSAFQDFLIGLANFGSAVMPFFSWLGGTLNQALGEFGAWLGNLSIDPEFLAWLEDMKVTLADGAEALGSMVWFLKELVDALDRAGGNEALKDITAQFNQLAKLLATDEGTKTMEALLHVIQILAYFFIFLVNDILVFLFLLEVTAEFIKNGLLPAIADFFTNKLPEFFNFVGGKILEFKSWLIAGFKEGFDKTLENMEDFLIGLLQFLIAFQATIMLFFINLFIEIGSAVISGLFNIAGAIATWLHDRAMDIGNFFSNLAGTIAGWASGLWNSLFEGGRNLISGLIDGIQSRFPALMEIANRAAAIFRAVWPFSPAKEGPLSGSGDPMIAGQKLVERIATGIEMETPNLVDASYDAASSVLVGANAVQMNFYGQTPTQSQAAGIGAAAGNSLADTIARRDTRLAIRSIGSAVATG